MPKTAKVYWFAGPERFIGEIRRGMLLFVHETSGIHTYGIGGKRTKALLIASLIDDAEKDPELGRLVHEALTRVRHTTVERREYNAGD